MNISYKTLFILFSICTLSFTACDDDDDETTPTTPTVQFSFSDPTGGQTFGHNDTVHINGMITFENDLHGYEITLKSEHFDSTVYSVNEHADGNTIHVHKMWVNDLTHHSDMIMTIDAFTDHDGQKETSTIDFHCHPM